MSLVTALLIAGFLGAVVALAIWRLRGSADRLVHKELRRRAHEGMLKLGVPTDAGLAARFHEQATDHLVRLDRAINRVSNKAEQGNSEARAVLVVLSGTRRELVADIDWSKQFLA